MTSQHDKPKRWRPRFSIRTLVIVVTLVCVYFGCWKLTGDYAVDAAVNHCMKQPGVERVFGQFTPAPFIVVLRSWTEEDATTVVEHEHYYFGLLHQRD